MRLWRLDVKLSRGVSSSERGFFVHPPVALATDIGAREGAFSSIARRPRSIASSELTDKVQAGLEIGGIAGIAIVRQRPDRDIFEGNEPTGTEREHAIEIGLR